jgi:hypothetical protein
MYSYESRQPVLECQSCGVTVRELTAAEARVVAERPYDFIVYCGQHRDDWVVEARRDGLL